MESNLKHLNLANEDRLRLRSKLDRRAEFIKKLLNLIEENMIDHNVLSLPWTSVTEIGVESLNVNSDNEFELQCHVRATFPNTDSLCKSCLNSNRDKEVKDAEKGCLDLSQQVNRLLQMIRCCD